MNSLDYEWARRKVAELLRRLASLLTRGVQLGDDPPFVDTRPDVRPAGEQE